MYQWNWDWIWNYKSQLLDGAWITLLMNIIILIIGTTLGIILGLMKRSNTKIIRNITVIYIDLFRTVPVLVLLIWFYFCMPILFNFKINSITAAIVVLSINLSAFVAEIVDAGIQNVPKIHIESGVLLGLTKFQNLRFITLPIALRNMTPPLVGQYINSIKLSVLASVISVPELLNVSQDIISQTYRPLEFYTVLAVVFLVFLLPGTIWSKKLEARSFYSKKSSSNNGNI